MKPLEAASLQFWESLSELGFVLVIIGVVGESAELIKKWRERYQRTWSEKAERALLPLETIFFVILVLGLAMEFLGSHTATRIADHQNAELSRLAAEANERATKLESKNVSMALLIEKLRQENLALSSGIMGQSNRINQVTRRRVPDVGFGEALKGVPEMKVYLVNTADAEAGLTAFQLQSGFELAGWKVERTELPSTQLQGSVGIRIECRTLGFGVPSRQDHSEEAA